MRREPVPQFDDIAYRDYLVDVLEASTSTAPTEFEQPNPKGPTWLAGRFKQSFTATDNTVIGANVVACEVLAAALVEDMGLQATSVPTQGTLSPRARLDALIAATGNTRERLQGTYCIDLARSDLETTTRVRENIRTIQQLLADGPIEGLQTGFLPFFLYKEEWRLQKRTPFFPENHRRLLHGAFATSADRRRADTLVARATAFTYPADATSSTKVALTSAPIIAAYLTRIGQLLQADTEFVKGHRHLTDQQYRLADDSYATAERTITKVVGQLGFNGWTADQDGSNPVELDTTISLGDTAAFRTSLDPAHSIGASARVFWGSSKFTGYSPAEWPKAWGLYKDHPGWKRVDVATGLVPSGMPYSKHLFDELARRYDQRAAKPVRSMAELAQLEALTTVSLTTDPSTLTTKDAMTAAVVELHDELLALIPHQYFFQLPLCRATVAHGMGQYPLASRRLASVRQEDLMRATLLTPTPTPPAGGSTSDGDLPWGWDTHGVAGVGRDYPYLNTACELTLLQLRFAALYLDWADALYRTDEFAEVARARKLYEGVLRIYGFDPSPDMTLQPLPLRVARSPRTVLDDLIGPRRELTDVTRATTTPPNPTTPAAGTTPIRTTRGDAATPSRATRDANAAEIEPPEAGMLANAMFVDAGPATIDLAQAVETGATFGGVVETVLLSFNPAVLAQQQRARLALTQIAAGTNYFGYRDDMVPLLRYRPLAAAAQQFATSAAQAEADAIRFAGEAARAELGLMRARAAIATAAARVAVESERIIKADDERLAAEVQVKRVKAAIAVKQKEIADHNDICGQVGDWLDGITDFFSSSVPGKVGSYVKSDASAALGLSEATAGATAGLGVVGGMALWGIGNAITLSGMADEANARLAALAKLEQEDLLLANAALDARRREVAIAQGQKIIAQLEAQYAQEVYRYSSLQFLDRDAWNQMAITMRSVLRRYLELGAMTGWLAERALTYEQDRTIDVMRLDYEQPDRAGLLASAQLQADLALLEGEFLTGRDATVPLTWTVSLAQQHPLQFGQLVATGSCSFGTDSDDLRLAYPGSCSHRIRAVDVVTVQPVLQPPPRGTLHNSGISAIVSSDGSWHHLVRRPDTFPLSEFHLTSEHLTVFDLPDIGLMPFEGSGYDTTWTLQLPPAANPVGHRPLLDVCITFHLTAQFTDAGSAPASRTVRRTALLSARRLFEDSWSEFQSHGAPLAFEVQPRHLTAGTDRKVTNVGVFVNGDDVPDLAMALTPGDTRPVEFTAKHGRAFSTQVTPPATVAGAGAGDLDALFERGDIDPATHWAVEVLTEHPVEGVSDVWLGIEYEVTSIA